MNLRLKRKVLLFLFVCLLILSVPAFAAKGFQGEWQITITIPVAPNSNTTRTFTLSADVSPRENDSLHGRMLLTDDNNQTVGGVWRQVGKKVSITYELPCDGSSPCASLILLGRIKSNTKIKNGTVIVMWDTPNDQNYALYDTSNGQFSAERLE